MPLPLPLVGRQHGKATNITIPIEEGEQYRMGRLVIRSADPDKGLSLKRDYLESMFPLKKGDIFDVDKIRKAIEELHQTLRRVRLHRFHGDARRSTSMTTPRPSI